MVIVDLAKQVAAKDAEYKALTASERAASPWSGKVQAAPARFRQRRQGRATGQWAASAETQVRDGRNWSTPPLSVPRRDLRCRSRFRQHEEWWLAIPEGACPRKDQPFYHLFAENAKTGIHRLRIRSRNLLPDNSGRSGPPSADRREVFARTEGGNYWLKPGRAH